MGRLHAPFLLEVGFRNIFAVKVFRGKEGFHEKKQFFYCPNLGPDGEEGVNAKKQNQGVKITMESASYNVNPNEKEGGFASQKGIHKAPHSSHEHPYILPGALHPNPVGMVSE